MSCDYQILLVEDNPGDAGLIQEYLQRTDQSKSVITVAETLRRALDLLDEQRFDGIILDLNLPDSNGLTTFDRIIKKAPDAPIIILTGLKDDSIGIQAVSRGAQDYLSKGQLNENILQRALKYAIERKKTLIEIEQRNHESDSLLEAARVVINHQDFQHSARRIFDICRSLTGATSGYVALKSEDGSQNDVLFLESGGLPCDVDPDLPMPIRGLRAEAYASQTVIYENDFMNSPWVEYMPADHVVLRNVLFAPMIIQKEVVGVIGLANKPSDFTKKDAGITRAFSDMAGIALSRYLDLKTLKQNEAYFRLLFENIPSGVAVFDPIDNGRDFIFQDYNKTGEKLDGLSRQEVLGKRVTEVFPGVAESGILKLFQDAYETDQIQYLADIPYEDNRLNVWRENWAYKLPTGKIVSMYNDISDQLEARHALHDKEMSYRLLFNSIRDALLIADNDRTILDCNPAFESLFGYTRNEILGRKTRIVYAEGEQFTNVGIELEKQKPDASFIITLDFKTKSGRIFPGETHLSQITGKTGRKDGVIGLVRDISDKRHLEAQVRQAQKMDAVGSLASGIAHDFNNLLTIILGNLDFALMDMDADNPLREDLQEILAAADRAQELTRQLLLYSRKGTQDLQPANLNEIIKQLLKLLQRLIGEDITIISNFNSDPRLVMTDRTNMEQLFMNLIVNARDAMPEGGKIIISTENIIINDDYAEKYAYARPGHFVKISIADTGCGMDKDILERIFEPFFTTKEIPDKKGTGLGLSVVYGIIKSHYGWVNAVSTPGEGTEFQIYLPTIQIGKAKKFSADTDETEIIMGTGERILIVEDERSVSKTLQRILGKTGYNTMVAETAREAEDIFEKEKGRFDLLFTDTILPDINGLDLAIKLKNISPGLKVLIGSGYTGDKVSRDTIRDEGFPFIQKPYGMSKLLSTIRKTIDK